MELNPKEVYRVHSDEDPTALIALDAQAKDGRLTWFDTSRDRGHHITNTRKEGAGLVFETKGGFTYRFEPLTKEIYDREVRPRVELSPEFESTESLRAFYLREFLGASTEEA